MKNLRNKFKEKEWIKYKKDLERQKKIIYISKRSILLGTIEEQSANVNNNLTESRIGRNSSVESFTDYEGELLRSELFYMI